MPFWKRKAKKPSDSGSNNAPKKLDKATLKRLEKTANAYAVYEQRLGLRATMSLGEKNELLRQFMDNFKDEIAATVTANNLHSLTDERLMEMGVKGTSLAFVKSFSEFCSKARYENFVTNIANNSDYLGDVEKDLIANSKSGVESEEKTETDFEASPDQAKGLRDVAMFLYRNAESKTAAARGNAKLGKGSQMIFVEELLGKSAKQRLLVYYLIENDKTKGCTLDDVVASQSYIPDKEKIKAKLLRKGIARLFSKVNLKWEVIGDAIQTAGMAINSTSLSEDDMGEPMDEKSMNASVEALAEAKAGPKAEKPKDSILDNINISKLAYFYDDDEELERLQNSIKNKDKDKEKPEVEAEELEEKPLPGIVEEMKLLPFISMKLRAALDDQVKNEDTSEEKQEEISRLQAALEKIKEDLIDTYEYEQSKETDQFVNNSIQDPTAPNLAILKKVSDGLCKLPKVPTMTLGTAASLAAVLINVATLIDDYKILSKADVSQRVLTLTASIADLSASASKTGLVTAALLTANPLNLAGAMATASTVSGALGVVAGGLSMTVAAVDIGHAAKLSKGSDKAGAYLDIAQSESEKDESLHKAKPEDLKFAKNIQGFITSMTHMKAIGAGKNMVAGTLTALGGALTLSGFGLVIGIPMMVAGLTANLIGMAVQKIRKKKEVMLTIDRYLGLNEIVDKLAEQYGFKDDKNMKALVMSELRLFGEAKMGAASHTQAYNIIMARYAHFLHENTFYDENGHPVTKDYYDDPDSAKGSGQKALSFACMTMVSALGVQMKFSPDGVEQPGTTEELIRGRMQL